MVCGSSCCGQTASPLDSSQEDATPVQPLVPESKDGCCDERITTIDEDSKVSCSNNRKEMKDNGCTENCCEKVAEKALDSIGCGMKDSKTGNNFCASKSINNDSKEKCRLAQEPLHAEDPKPDCCKNKGSPCCDVSCLDRIALRECENENTAVQLDEASKIHTGSSGSSQCRRGKDGKPCTRHSRATRDKYAATLEALGCICRALLALGKESCCITQEQSSPKKRRCSERSSQPKPCASVDCCRATAASSSNGSLNPSSTTRLNSCSKGCCSAPNVSDSCTNVCSSGKQTSRFSLEESKDILHGKNHITNLEKGLLGKDHVILSVSGMTCTGCETKLKRALGMLESVGNLKTSLVLARAEFDVDLSVGSVVDIMKHLERTTEFKCERVANQGFSIDLIAPGDPSDFIKRDWPRGVTEMTIVDKKTVRVAFDAGVIGPRDLVENGWNIPVNLAASRPDPSLEVGSKHVRYVGYMTLLSISLTVPVLVLAWAPLPKKDIAYGSASLALATIIQFVVAGPFYTQALKSFIFSRIIEMDLLIVLSTSTAYIFSVVSFGYLVAGRPLSTGEFFETSTLLVTLIMIGRYVSALARQKAVESISIRSLQTFTAVLVDEAGHNETEIDARLLQYGDYFKVAPDSRIPTDGTVISGSSEVDESMITGESMPVEKYADSVVIAGSINRTGTLIIRLTRLPGENTISTISSMVDEAKLSKPKIQDMADRVASYFVPVVIALTILTLVIWIAIGVAVRKQSGAEAVVQAITYAISVLIVSCPCAIGLAVPMVVVVASGVAAEKGVIFKSADSIEVAYKTSHVVFDKTGTLTQGKLTVAAEKYIGSDSSSSMSLLLGLVSSIKHPVSSAVAAHLKAKGISASVVSDVKTLTGKGVEGTMSGLVLRGGNSRWLDLSSDPNVQPLILQGYTVFCFTINKSLAAVFGLEDSIRPDAVPTITKLHERDISVHIISGDDDGAVRSLATKMNIPISNVRSRCTPGDKQTYIQNLLTSAPKDSSTKPVVIFCGDGTNDAVALAQATIGVHMNEGTDVAKSASDVVLMRPSLGGILSAIDISKKSVNRIRFNFVWAFIYNLFAVLLAAGAFVNARIPPEYAGLGELVSVLPVIAAAVLLRWSKI